MKIHSLPFACVIFLILGALSAANSQTHVSGTVSGLWTKQGSPYIITDDIQIEESDTLLIEPGVHVLFDGHFSLRANGHLFARGTHADSILFSHNHPDSMWAGIGIHKNKNKSVLEFCRIEYSDQSGINIYNTSPTIRHCHILNNTDTGTTYHVGEGGGIDIHSANPLLEFNVIEYNSSNRGGGIHVDGYFSELRTECQILNNIIRYNTATWGGGIRVFSSSPIIKNNVLDGNSVPDSLYGGNLYVYPGSHPTIVHNIIINSPSGSGLIDLSNSLIKYNNVWNNKPYDYVDTSAGIGDISVDPLFVGGNPFDYHLQPGSLCIDAGDSNEPLDPDNSRADIGVFYYGTDTPPLPVADLSATEGDTRVTFQWQNPNLIDYDYTIIVRNNSTFPQSPQDGATIFEGTQTLCQDTGLMNGQTYYYSAFVYDNAGLVSEPVYRSTTPEHQTSSVLRVPWDYIKIQDALNASSAGDTVLVWPGTYSPTVNGESFPIVMADSVVLMSKDGREATIIDAEQTNLVLLGANGATLRGFTVTGGWNSTIAADSVGIYSEPYGGGILCLNILYMEIIDNIITGNRADGPHWPDGYGGGIGCYNSEVLISNNLISENYAQRDYGGIACIARERIGTWPNQRYPKCNITSNIILSNNGCGIGIGGIYAVIKNNVIAFNKVNGGGIPLPGGVDLASFYWGSAEISNNTIAYNYNVDQPGNISGIYYGSGVNPINLKNNIVWGHREHEVVIGNTVPPSGAANFMVSYSCIEDGYQGIGNLSADPQFIDADNFNFSLAENSPCIDAGDPNSSGNPDGTRADIGANYFHHAGVSKLRLPTNKISIFIDQGQDTTISLKIGNDGDWPLQIKMSGEAGSNSIDIPEPSKHGYSWIDSDHPNGPQYDWIEIESIGTKIEIRETVELPFEFCFFDKYYSATDILYYGLLEFEFEYPYHEDNAKIPYWTPPNNIAAAFWDNFERNGQQGSIYYYIDQQNERLIVEYIDMHRKYNPGPDEPKETFEIILNKEGTLLYQYKDVSETTSATVGIESMYGRDGVQIAYNEDYLHDNMAIKIFVGAPWIDIPLMFAKIEPNNSKDIKINVPASSLDAGTYDAVIVIETNDNDQAIVKIPVYLNVNPSGGDIVRPSSVTDLFISNLADSTVTLAWTATGDDSTTGLASQYDLRFHTSPPQTDTLAWWENAQKYTTLPKPSPAGQRDSVIVKLPSPKNVYFFALKVGDDAGNWSALSDIVYYLPVSVELSAFEARVENDKIVLSWKTYSETNNLGFEIQRKSAQLEFQNIGFIKGRGTSSDENRYTFVDEGLEPDQTYQYRLKQIETNGACTFSEIVEASVALSKTYALHQNYPNPFNPSTTIKYELPKDAHVTLAIYNALGQEVEKLVDENKKVGYYTINWNASDKSTGVYFIVMQSAEFSKTRKILLLR